jgi:arylformamidase
VFTIIDLTQTLTAESLSYPGDVPAWTSERLEMGSPRATVTRFSSFDPHGGTHMDAPLHFAPEGVDVSALPLRLYPAVVVSIDGPRIEADSIPADCAARAVLFSTGWEDRVGTPGYYEGFPSITGDAAQLLVDRGVGLVGLDSPSVDSGAEHPTYPAHEILCGAGLPIVEGLVNLRALLSVTGEVLFAAFPLKLDGIEGSPVRAVALVRDECRDQRPVVSRRWELA